jgi:predicted Zn-dependent protease with MMP-like domain
MSTFQGSRQRRHRSSRHSPHQARLHSQPPGWRRLRAPKRHPHPRRVLKRRQQRSHHRHRGNLCCRCRHRRRNPHRGPSRVAVRMDPQRFDELVSDALDLIPHELAAVMDNVVVLVADRDPEESDLLGLYEGVALTERDSNYAGSLPDTITIYREALLDVCDSDNEVVDEVAITVIHEIAHHFGIDDDRLHELGWA